MGLVVAAAAIALAIAAATGADDDAAPQTAPVVVTGAALPELTGDPADPALGTPAPGLAGTSFDGSPVSVDPGAGSPVLVLFLAHWCPHCRAEVPLLSEWIRAGDAPPGVDIVAVSTAVDEAAPNYPPSAWFEEEEWPTPVLVDDESGSAGTAYGLTHFPYFVLLNGDGTVADRFSGEIAPEELAARIAAALE